MALLPCYHSLACLLAGAGSCRRCSHSVAKPFMGEIPGEIAGKATVATILGHITHCMALGRAYLS